MTCSHLSYVDTIVQLFHYPARSIIICDSTKVNQRCGPTTDISPNTLHSTEHTTRHPDLGLTPWYAVEAGEKNAQRGAWQHTGLPAYASELEGRVASHDRPWTPSTKKTNES